MQFSIIICTYNRGYNLSKCIAHLAVQDRIIDIEWEIVIVDNNSSDGTDKIVADLTARHNLNIRYVFESQQGLNYARNAGILASKGRYFAFIDDDIVVSHLWLASLYRAFKENDADANGGRIHLEQSLQIPSWIRPDMYGFLGYQDYGEEPCQLDGIEKYPFGGNMVFNRRVVVKIGLFNPKLGRKGAGQRRGELVKGSEADYFRRLAAAGGRIYYQPDALVYHRILPFQLRKNYFRTIHHNAGYQKAFNDQTTYRRTFYGIPLFLYPQLIRAIGRYMMQVAVKGTNLAFRQQMTVLHFLGTMRGYMHKRRRQGLTA